jgi:hypothetical protein
MVNANIIQYANTTNLKDSHAMMNLRLVGIAESIKMWNYVE